MILSLTTVVSTYFEFSGVMEERVYSLDKGAPGCADPNPDEPGCFTPPEGCLTEETQLPASILKNLEVDYSCSQAEQIYGIAVQKMHEKDNCRVSSSDIRHTSVIPLGSRLLWQNKLYDKRK